MKARLLKFIPRSVKEAAKKTLAQISAITITAFSLTGFTASLYYLLIDRSFYREHRASLLGRLAFRNKLNNVESSSALLRRNIHRLEKGLIMLPRRSSFAEAYILETVLMFELANKSKSFCVSEITWADDVLSQYFEVVTDKGRIAKARKLYISINALDKAPHNTSEKSVPYNFDSLPELDIDYEQIMGLFKKRRSVRWFTEQNVEKNLLEKAINAASLAPSACNRQPFFFNYTIDTNKATEIADCAMGTVGFADNIQSLIVVVGDLSNYPSERDRHVIYIDASLAAMQLMLSLETLGLSSCPINWPDVEERERLLQKKLNLEFYERPVMLIAVGYARPEGQIPFSQKKSADLLLKEIV